MYSHDYIQSNLPNKYEWKRFLENKDLELINSWCMDVSYRFTFTYTAIVHTLCLKIDETLREHNMTFFDIVHASSDTRYKFVMLIWNKVFIKLGICNPCNIEDYNNIIMIYNKWCDHYRIKELVANDCVCKKCLR